MSYILKLFFAITFIVLFIINTALSKPIKIIVLGDSLVAGYGLLEKDGFVKKLEGKTQNINNNVIFLNGGVSGETSSGLRSRLDWVLEDKFDGVIVAIGANDALRGISPEITNNNIDIILNSLKKLNIPTMLIGMKAPNNLGLEYVSSFNKMYPILSKKYKTYFYPFFLSNVALVPELNQKDMIHPNKQGVEKIIKKIFPYVLEFINSFKKS